MRRPRRVRCRSLWLAPRRGAGLHCRTGVSLAELLAVVTVIAVLVSMAAPRFQRCIEQSHVDIAAANLRVIWNAERLHWLENHAYSADLAGLVAAGLLDASVTAGSTRYSYSITLATAGELEVEAVRVGSSVWSGAFVITESGIVSGELEGPHSEILTPGFQ